MASVARVTSPEARSASESVPSTRPTASSQPARGRIRSERAPCSARPAPRRACRTSLTRISRAASVSRRAARRCSSAPAASRAASRAASASAHRGRDGRELLLRPGHRLGGGLRRGEQSRGFRFRFGSVALARGQLLADFRSGFVDPRERCRHAFGGEIDFVAGIPRGDPFARGVQGLRPRFLEVPLERETGGRGFRGQAIGFFAGERAGARFGDRPRQTLLEVGEVPRRPGLLGREVAAFPLEGGAARGEIQGRAAVGLEKSVVPSDRGFERRQGFPHRVPPGRGLARPRGARRPEPIRRARARPRPRLPGPAARREVSRSRRALPAAGRRARASATRGEA